MKTRKAVDCRQQVRSSRSEGSSVRIRCGRISFARTAWEFGLDGPKLSRMHCHSVTVSTLGLAFLVCTFPMTLLTLLFGIASTRSCAVPTEVVHGVWDAFNTTADGLSINEAECISICSCLQTLLGHDRGAVASATRRLFRLLDIDEVGAPQQNSYCVYFFVCHR